MDKVYSLKPGFMCRPGLQPLMMSGDSRRPQRGLVKLRTHFLKQWKQALRAVGRAAPPTATGRRRALSCSGEFSESCAQPKHSFIICWNIYRFYSTADHRNYFYHFGSFAFSGFRKNWQITSLPNTSNPRKTTIIQNSYNFFFPHERQELYMEYKINTDILSLLGQ